MAEGRYQPPGAGDQSRRGLARECLIDAIVTFEGAELRAEGGFTLRLTDFNICPVSVTGGLLELKDEVQLSFDILAQV